MHYILSNGQTDKVAKAEKLSANTLNKWVNLAKADGSYWRLEQRVLKKMESASFRELVIAFDTIFSKYQLMSGEVTARVETRNENINQTEIRDILGRAFETGTAKVLDASVPERTVSNPGQLTMFANSDGEFADSPEQEPSLSPVRTESDPDTDLSSHL
jgi:transposase-like protein